MWWAELLNNLVAQLGTGAGASASSFESIATATGTGSSGTITFSSIPSTYKHLQIRILSSSTNTSPVTVSSAYIRVNGDTGANYAYHSLYGNTVSAAATGATASTFAPFFYTQVIQSTSGYFGAAVVDFHDYADTSKYKTSRVFSGGDTNTSGSFNGMAQLGSGLWLNTAAINSITIISNAGNFATGSTFALYGIKG